MLNFASYVTWISSGGFGQSKNRSIWNLGNFMNPESGCEG